MESHSTRVVNQNTFNCSLSGIHGIQYPRSGYESVQSIRRKESDKAGHTFSTGSRSLGQVRHRSRYGLNWNQTKSRIK